MSCELRICLTCGAEKPLTDFPGNKNKKNNRVYVRYDCRECVRAAARRWYYEHTYGPSWRDHIASRRPKEPRDPTSTKPPKEPRKPVAAAPRPLGFRQWRQRLIAESPLCERCAFVPQHSCQLHLHHRDGNRRHNARPNLAVLCANCHVLVTVYQNACRHGQTWPDELLAVVLPWCQARQEV